MLGCWRIHTKSKLWRPFKFAIEWPIWLVSSLSRWTIILKVILEAKFCGLNSSADQQSLTWIIQIYTASWYCKDQFCMLKHIPRYLTCFLLINPQMRQYSWQQIHLEEWLSHGTQWNQWIAHYVLDYSFLHSKLVQVFLVWSESVPVELHQRPLLCKDRKPLELPPEHHQNK